MAKRKLCSSCERPLATCLCADLVTLPSNIRVVILQDPKEARHALSSAPILARSIICSLLVVGETFDPLTVIGPNWRSSLLLYPSESAIGGAELEKYPIENLIVLDGTWRKASRLLHLNPWLRELPCLAINEAGQSRYRIRKSPREDGLSTIEAAVQALNLLHDGVRFEPILGAFEKMIDLQITAMGESVYQKNYSEKRDVERD